MNVSIGDRIRALREFRDITQEQLAQRASVSVDTIRKLEQGFGSPRGSTRYADSPVPWMSNSNAS